MSRVRRDAGVTAALSALAFALALWQMPGRATSDTKIDLYVDPLRFLAGAGSVWTNTTDLGDVHSSQYGGYLWPMGPWFAVCHLLGISPWLAERLWLGLVLALAAWGLMRLLDALIGGPRGVAHVVAGAVYVVNPYTVVFTARTTITLLGYAALPWLLLAVHRGVRVSPVSGRGGRLRRWWWPAVFALIVTSAGGGVNAAVVVFAALGPLVLLVYEPLMGHVSARAAWGFAVRAGLLSAVVSLWWLAGLLAQAHYGINFLQYTEQPATIWATNSVTESLRLMGYWTSYLGSGYPTPSFPYFADGGTLLFNGAVVVASLLVPALACLSFAWTRRARYAPFLLALVLTGVVVMAAGFPAGTPLHQTMQWLYYHVSAVSFLRTVDKAAPLTALGLAGLLGLVAGAAVTRLRDVVPAGPRRGGLVAGLAALAVLIALAGWPLITGDAPDRQITWQRIPSAWRQAGRALDAGLPANTRAVVLPGQVFAFYRWGGTIDAILPRLTRRPVAVRYETPYADLHADDLLTTIDSLVQQARAFPGQLVPLLRLIGAGAVIQGTDDDLARSGAVDPSIAARVLVGQGLGAARSYGAATVRPRATGTIDPSLSLAPVRQFAVGPGRGIVHVDVGPPTIVDGSAEGLAGLAAFGALPARAPIFYAGDLPPAIIAHDAAAGADLVITDSSRRRLYTPQFTLQNTGPVLTAATPIAAGEAELNPFATRGAGAQTVTVVRGAASIEAPSVYGFNQFPEQAPIAAFDGDPTTAWVPDAGLAPAQRWVQIDFTRPRDVPYVDVTPLDGPLVRVTALTVDGRLVRVGPGTTRIPLDAHAITSLRVGIASFVRANDRSGTGGIREIGIPGVHVSQALRSPLLISRAVTGTGLGHASLTWLFARQTADNPFRRDRYVQEPTSGALADAQDPERAIVRQVLAPATRPYRVDARVTVAVTASDAALDRLAGVRSADVFTSSSRFENEPRYRASSAFDGDPATAWIGDWIGRGAPAPWIAWRTPRPLMVRRLRLASAAAPVRHPTVVRLSWPAGHTGPLAVGRGGSVVLPAPVRTRSLTMTILAAAFAPGTPAGAQSARAVGIGAVLVPGLARVAVPRAGTLHAPCGTVAVAVGGRRVALRVAGDIAALNAGAPLVATGCGAPVTLAAGPATIDAPSATFSVDLLRLRSPAPNPLATAAAVPGRLLSAGRLGTDSVTGVRVSVDRPAWVVLGESYDAGWQARCNGRGLGSPHVIDGYANGWLAPAGCRTVAFTFAPQATAAAADIISGVAIALLVVMLLALGPPALRHTTLAPLRLAAGSRRPALTRAAVLAVALGVILGFVFAKRAGVGIAAGTFVVLWRGVGPRLLTIAAGALLGVAVPLAYLIADPRNEGGYDFAYSVQLIAAHWIGVAAVVGLGLAVAMTIRAARRSEA